MFMPLWHVLGAQGVNSIFRWVQISFLKVEIYITQVALLTAIASFLLFSPEICLGKIKLMS